MTPLWYPDRFDVEIVAHGLAARLFPGYGSPLPASSFLQAKIHDNPLLESALGLPRQPYYKTIYDKAGALLRSMVKNHPFVDGNKRLGMATTSIFMLMNHRVFWPPNEEMVRFALELAASEPDMSWREVARWIRKHTLTRDEAAEQIRTVIGLPLWLQTVNPDASGYRLFDWIAALDSTLDDLAAKESST